MRRGRTTASISRTDFQDDQWFFQFGGLFRKTPEFFAILDTFDGEQHHIGGFGMQHEARKIQRINVGLVAATGFVTDAETMLHGAPHHVDLP